MLTNIRISNYALISNLDIDFNHGFSVITGETGAGKSIILGALGLVLGERADTKNIRDGEQKCIIEADFDIEGYDLQDFFIQNDLDYSTQCTIRRELNQNGKSRSFVNDTPINLSALKELGIKLIDIHSQHQNLQLGKNEFQRQIIDRIADNHTIITEYKQAYSDYQTTKHQLEKLKERAAQEKADQDYIEFQFNQLDSAHLKAGESVELEEELLFEELEVQAPLDAVYPDLQTHFDVEESHSEFVTEQVIESEQASPRPAEVVAALEVQAPLDAVYPDLQTHFDVEESHSEFVTEQVIVSEQASPRPAVVAPLEVHSPLFAVYPLEHTHFDEEESHSEFVTEQVIVSEQASSRFAE